MSSSSDSSDSENELPRVAAKQPPKKRLRTKEPYPRGEGTPLDPILVEALTKTPPSTPRGVSFSKAASEFQHALKVAGEIHQEAKEKKLVGKQLGATAAAAKHNDRNPRSYSFVFTLNNYSDADFDFLESVVCRYIVYGKEIAPTTKTPHLQGTIYYPTQRTWSAVVGAFGPRYHVEVCKDFEASVIYCKKEGDFTERGIMPLSTAAKAKLAGDAEKDRWDQMRALAEAGNFEDIPSKDLIQNLGNLERIYDRKLRTMQHGTVDIANEWHYGAPGSGKSRSLYDKYPNAYRKPLNKWWDGYQNHDVVIIEDIDPDYKHMAHHVKIWADHYPFVAERKGGSMVIRPRKILITSNYSIDEVFSRDVLPVMRRFDVFFYPGIGMPVVPMENPYSRVALTPSGRAATFNGDQDKPQLSECSTVPLDEVPKAPVPEEVGPEVQLGPTGTQPLIDSDASQNKTADQHSDTDLSPITKEEFANAQEADQA